jgi:stress-induced morphogen
MHSKAVSVRNRAQYEKHKCETTSPPRRAPTQMKRMSLKRLRPPRPHLKSAVTVPESRPMPMQAQEIEDLIRESFPDATITITDLRGDGNHYAAEVIDASFAGMNRVQQHRSVTKALKGKMDGSHGELHALALTTKAS